MPKIHRHAHSVRASRRHALAAALLAFAATLALQAPSPARADSLASAAQPQPQPQPRARTAAPAKVRLDHSGHKRVGMASYYARRFSGRRMADGTPMRPESDNAASRTLPLGTRARVTNPSNGKSAVVTIRDRGPYAKGRIIDLSPRTARQLDMVDAGVARVEVVPLTVPQPNGTVLSLLAMSEPAWGSGAARRANP